MFSRVAVLANCIYHAGGSASQDKTAMTHRILTVPFLLIVLGCFYWTNLIVSRACGQEAATKARSDSGTEEPDADGGSADVELDKELQSILEPLFKSLSDADVSRATVEMLADSVMNGQVVQSETSTFQIASTRPNQFTVYLKQPDQRTRLYCDGKKFVAAMAPDAYFELPEVISIQQAVTDLPVPMGPYPEPLLALTMAGANPAISFVAGMKSINLIDQKLFRDKVPASHVRGVQADGVIWDLWVTDEASPKPLRLLVDMTPMLIASDQVHVPEGFSYQVRYDFLTWRVAGDVDNSLFVFTPAKDAVKYKSLDDYFASIAGVNNEHPLLGTAMPGFTGKTIDGKSFDSRILKDRVVVLDFWATWCSPCLSAMPIIQNVVKDFKDQKVLLIAINTGEEGQKVAEFLKQQELDLNVLLDPDGKIADGFVVDAIPQTILIGKDGTIEAVHVGFDGDKDLKETLSDELEVLTVGGKLASATKSAK